MSNELKGINLNCSSPKLIKTEAVAAELPEIDNSNEINEEQIKKILEQLQSGKELDLSNMNKLMGTLQKIMHNQILILDNYKDCYNLKVLWVSLQKVIY